ncbi:MAG: GNAT family N-acetyltransferase [Gammaproteobacteria bacterium RIFCSPHIGHO2_12_FULL_37_14]|nr:MAG: GNAT family N-acetyltransferase [Gammaproteobacteria bacterium RIFCSPHIGHO2_12_FULL_37_14]
MKILETKRLILRNFTENDIEILTEINQDPKVCEFLPAIGTRDSTEKLIKKIIEHDSEHGFSLYAVELKSTGEMIGWCGLMIPSFEAHFTPAVEIGWRLASNQWNQGYATEAAIAALEYAFKNLKLKEIVSFTAEDNIRSRRVMEKIGLHHDLSDDFDHPKIEKSHPLCRHVLYRISSDELIMNERYEP